MVSPESAKKIAAAFQLKVKDLFDACGTDRTLSSQTVTHHLRCISSVLSTAVEWQVIVANPCDRVKAPRQSKKKIHFLEIDEVQKLIEAVIQLDDIRIRTAVLIFLYTGIRKGELAALEWRDIDFECQTMTVERNMQYIRGHGLVTTSTKTESGERFISVSVSLIDQLRKYRIWQTEERLKAGSEWVERDRLFTRWNGDYIAPSTVYHWVKTFLIEQGHSEMTVHGLRHTNISVLLSQGVDLITASRRAGHSRPSTTANIYAHALRKPDELAADVLEGLLSKKTVASG
jgi:integrase